MRVRRRLLAFSLICVFAGCAGFQVAGQHQAGRQALLINQPETALAYFLEAAKSDPDYVYQSMYFREGIWTYVGRSQYALGRYNEARQSLERALAKDRDDNLARLYLGLTLARSGDTARGTNEIESAMKEFTIGLNISSAAVPSESIGIRRAQYAAPSRRIWIRLPPETLLCRS